MASIRIQEYIVEIKVHKIDGIFHRMLGVPVAQGYWVYFTIQQGNGSRESFPFIGSDNQLRIYPTYESAMDDVAQLLSKYIA